MEITLPEVSLVLLLGPSCSGKSTFAKNHFRKEDILSQEQFLRMVAGENRSPRAHQDAQSALTYILEKRLRNGLLTVVDGSHVSQISRKLFRQISRKSYVPMYGIWLDLPEDVLRARFEVLDDPLRSMSQIRQQMEELAKYDLGLKAEGFRTVYRLNSEQEIDEVNINIKPLPCNRQEETGPFDLIGDVHGCLDELILLLARLGYQVKLNPRKESTYVVTPPEGRRVVFVGDLVDRGPDSPGVLKLVMDMVQAGTAFCVTGNHDDKFKRHLMGRKVKVAHGLEQTLAQMENEDEEFETKVRQFLQSLPDHLVLDGGRITVAHAGIKEAMQGRQSGEVRSFCMYGETTGETDEFGLPVRHNWAGEYEGESIVVYGHTPVPEAIWQNQTINIDTGCVFGGALSALRFPEKEIISVPAAKVYSEPKRPLAMNLPDLQQNQQSEFINFERIAGRNLVTTRDNYYITIKDQASPSTLEFLELGGLNPRWLIYLPPRLSPTKSSTLPGYLEHLTEALSYYAKKGLDKVLVEEMQGGEEVTIVIAKNEVTAIKRFGIRAEGFGAAINSKGHPYFKSELSEQQFLKRFRKVIDSLELWEAFDTDWFCISGEMTPGAKNWQELATNFHRINSAADASLAARSDALRAAGESGLDVQSLLQTNAVYQQYQEKFARVLKQHDLPFEHLEDLCFYPSYLLASEGKTYFDKEQIWHRQIWASLDAPDADLEEICRDLFKSPSYHWVDLNSEKEKRKAIAWFESLSEKCGAGVTVRSSTLRMESGTDLIQPGLTVRGREYLRLVYGMDYDRPDLLERHRLRRLKDIRQLTVRQLALGIEALSRFVEKQDLTSVYECNFALLALQTNDIDPRL